MPFTGAEMIDLDILATEDFRYSPLLQAKNTETIINLVAQTREVETARRSLVEDDYEKIEDFAEMLIKKHLKDGEHFDYDITLAALAIILIEYDEEFPEKFLAELAGLYDAKKAEELFWSRRVASQLLKLKKRLSSKVKNKVRKHFPDALFLPVDELGLIFDPPPHLAKLKIEQQLIIAVSLGDRMLNIIDHDGKVFELPEEAVLVSNKGAALHAPYLTDYGQTLGFGSYGDLEVEADWVFAQAKTTA